MKDCRVHHEVMSSYLDGAGSPAERAALEAHLAECPECRRALEELRWTTRQIRGLEPVEPPPWMTAKIMARLRENEAPSVSIWRRYFFPILASAQFRVASLVLVGAAGYYIVSRSTGVPLDVREARPAPETRESAPPDQKAFAPPPPARPAPQKEKKAAAPAPAPRAAAPPGLDERKGVPPPAADVAGPAAKAAMAPRVASADFAAPAPDSAVRLLVIRIDPFDPSGFGTVVERELRRAGVDVVTPPAKTDGRSLTARVESRRLPELLERLARIGSIRERPESLDDLPSVSVITVTIRW
jgi:Putative zinc-finger